MKNQHTFGSPNLSDLLVLFLLLSTVKHLTNSRKVLLFYAVCHKM